MPGRQVPDDLQPDVRHHGQPLQYRHLAVQAGQLELHPVCVGREARRLRLPRGERVATQVSPVSSPDIRPDSKINLSCRDLKKYIKTSSCYPDRCSQEDYDNIMKDFKRSEKVQKVHFLSPQELRLSLFSVLDSLPAVGW